MPPQRTETRIAPALIAENARAIVARRRFSQRTLATKLQMSQAGVSRRLAGTVEFSGSELGALAEALAVPVDAFYAEDHGTTAEVPGE